MKEFMLGFGVGALVTAIFWIVNRWFWISMYRSSEQYINGLVKIIEMRRK